MHKACKRYQSSLKLIQTLGGFFFLVLNEIWINYLCQSPGLQRLTYLHHDNGTYNHLYVFRACAISMTQ